MKSGFEEKLEAFCGEAELKAAKQLLKRNCLTGAWHDEAGRLHGVFLEERGAVECTVIPGEHAVSECSECRELHGFGCCRHGAALLMYSGRFHRGDCTETPPSYYGGLRRDPLPALKVLAAKKGTAAELWLDSFQASPHVPSRWENALFRGKIRCGGREYLGNLTNLRQIYFDKYLSSTVVWENFSLQDRQIIAFLALNASAEGGALSLPAELVAEFFHSLIGYDRFTRNGHPVIVRREPGEPVLLVNRRKCFPGLRISGAVIPSINAQVIAGRSGCWIGREDEYFFVPGCCEITHLRSFFSARPREEDESGLAAYREQFPFPLIDVSSPELPRLRPRLFLDGVLSPEAGLRLQLRFLYTPDDGPGVLCVPESGVVQGTFRRDRERELRIADRFALFGFTGNAGELTLSDPEHIGVFFTDFLPQLLSEKEPPVLGPGLLRGTGRNFACPVEFRTHLLGVTPQSWQLKGRLSAGDAVPEWKECLDTALQHRRFLFGPGGRLLEISAPLGAFFRSAGVLFTDVDPESMTFELPFTSGSCCRELCRELPGVLPPEVTAGPAAGPVLRTGPGFAFTGELRSYQQQGVQFMSYLVDRNFNCLLADEMGLGKTVQLLALLSSQMEESSLPALIVAPASLVTNWERECGRFVPGFKVGIPGVQKRKAFWEHYRKYNIIVISYTLARLDAEFLKSCRFSFLILDEAQHIKNPGSTNAKSCKSFRAAHRIVLTGTPLENSSADLWSIFDFLLPGMLGSLPAFRKRYADVAEDTELQNELKMRISPFILRRTKSEVAKDLPERSENTIFCDFSPRQRALYNDVLEEGRMELAQTEENAARAGTVIFSVLLRLRQVCCHPELLPEGRGKGVPSVKTELFMELVQQNMDSGHKMLAFSQFTSLLALLKPELDREGIAYEYLDGATTDRQKHVDRFNNDGDLPLFLLSLKAGGTGLNLVSADTVLIYDPWWNPAAELQAADRVHRIGQTRPVNICKLVVRNSIEEKILALQGRKKAIFDALITAESPDAKLSAAELRSLVFEE